MAIATVPIFCLRVTDGSRTVKNGGWLNTEDMARMAGGKFEIISPDDD